MPRGRKRRGNPAEAFLIGSTAVLLLVITVVAYVAAARSLQGNARRVAERELTVAAREQADLLERDIERQLMPLKFVVEYLQGGGTFSGGEASLSMEALMRANRICTIGYADGEGNVTFYDGTESGNISGRAYFSTVMDGNRDWAIEYLPTTIKVDEPRFLFSMPVLRDGAIQGVAFLSKEASVFEDILLENVASGDGKRIVLVDGAGTILTANQDARSALDGDDFFTAHTDGPYADDFDADALRAAMAAGESGCYVYGEGDAEEYVVFVPAGIGDWYLFTMMDRADMDAAYWQNTRSVHMTILVIILCFTAVLCYVVGYAVYHFHTMRVAGAKLRMETGKTEILLNELGCELFDYDVGTDEMHTGSILARKYGIDFENIFRSIARPPEPAADEALAGVESGDGGAAGNGDLSVLPEDFARVQAAFFQVRESGTREEMDFPIHPAGGLRWMRLTMIPYADASGRVSHIFGSFMDATEEHGRQAQRQSEEKTRMLRREAAYHEALMANCLGYIEASLSTGSITENVFRGEDGSTIPLAFHGSGYDAFIDWWAEHMLSAGREEFLRLTDRGYLNQRFLEGSRYEELTCSSRYFSEEERVLRLVYKMTDQGTADGPMMLCVVHDITEETRSRQEIHSLTEQLRESRIKNSVSQIQPHFLYNALGSIREIILEDPQYASDLICDFTTHLRACIRSMSRSDLIPFAEELENIRAYVNIEKMRFGKRLTVQYDIRESGFPVVPLSVQPLVENAIRHGIFARGKQGGTVWLSTRAEADAYVITVRDDGVGFDYPAMREAVLRGERDSTGLENVAFRLKSLEHAELHVESIPGEGTEITIRIPAEEKEKENA